MRRQSEWRGGREWTGSGENGRGDGMGEGTRVESSGEEGIGEEADEEARRVERWTGVDGGVERIGEEMEWQRGREWRVVERRV